MRLFRDLAGALGIVMVVLPLLAPRESYGDGDDYTDACAQNDDATNVCVSACEDARCDGENDLCLCKNGVRGCVCTRR